MNAIARYAQHRNETASKERLMMLLFEAALQHIRAGAAAFDAGCGAEGSARLSKATDIVLYLDATFDPRAAPKLAEPLGAVYRFVSGRCVAAGAKRDARLAREAEKVFAPVVEAFDGAVREVLAQRGEAR